ncbi:hypothetical protein J53TS2_06070 [Paenibacillus sp. J53TS2]|nr:hypothetical protein J53TS2_06070 [Paenibacillus sp. J53TS2]
MCGNSVTMVRSTPEFRYSKGKKWTSTEIKERYKEREVSNDDKTLF